MERIYFVTDRTKAVYDLSNTCFGSSAHGVLEDVALENAAKRNMLSLNNELSFGLLFSHLELVN